MREVSHLSWLLASPSDIARFNSVSPRREHMYATKEVQTIRFSRMLKRKSAECNCRVDFSANRSLQTWLKPQSGRRLRCAGEPTASVDRVAYQS